MEFLEAIKNEIKELKETESYRQIFSMQNRDENMFINISGKNYVDFSSNDYLSLSKHQKLINSAINSAKIYGIGSGGSRLLGGGFELHSELEKRIAKFKNKESAIFLNSGYQANVGFVQTLYKKGDVVFSDKLNHASIIDGLRLSGIDFIRFKHNDILDLKMQLEKHRNKYRNVLVMTESVFSMDGDIANLKDLVDLKEKYNFKIFVDEAHATGIFGEHGSGIVEEFGLTEKIDFVMGTFSKALGSFGAYIACDEIYKDYFINKCRSFIFSTSLPLPVIAANIVAIELIKYEPNRRLELKQKFRKFRAKLVNMGFNILGDSQIVPIIFGENKEAVKISDQLKNLGYWVMPIRYPTVPRNQARIRLSINFNHNEDILEKFSKDLSEIVK
jgi:8-amino-7-oxononanoate synthase